MTQNGLWHDKWRETVNFSETNRPWWKRYKKLMNVGEWTLERVEHSKQLL